MFQKKDTVHIQGCYNENQACHIESQQPDQQTQSNEAQEQTVVVVEPGESVLKVVQCVRVSLEFHMVASLALYPMCCKLDLWGSPIFFNALYAVRWFLRSISLHFSLQRVLKDPAIVSASSAAAILSSLSLGAVKSTKRHRFHPGKNFAARICKPQPPEAHSSHSSPHATARMQWNTIK
mgnify:CR=1 FL=1